MDKENALNVLYSALPFVEELENKHARINKLNSPYIRVSGKIRIFIPLIVLFFCVYSLILTITESLAVTPEEMAVQRKLQLILILGIVGAFVLLFVNSIQAAIRKKINRSSIEVLIDERDFAFENAENTGLPLDYLNSHAIGWLITYLENQRADNLKEAINLYEEQLKHDELIEYEHLMLRELARNSEKLDKINKNIDETNRQINNVESTVNSNSRQNMNNHY